MSTSYFSTSLYPLENSSQWLYVSNAMILVTTNKFKRLLYMSFINRVTPHQIRESEDEVRTLVADFSSGFRLLTDLERLEAMEHDSGTEIGRLMDFLKASGVELVVRIIPEPEKDIGLNILSIFHYGRELRTVTCDTIGEAAQVLKL